MAVYAQLKSPPVETRIKLGKYRCPTTSFLMKDDLVAFRCTNPALRRVFRVSADQSWIDVRWLAGSSGKSGRYQRSDLLLVNGIINEWVDRSIQ